MLYMHMSLYDMCTSCIQYISYVLCKLFNQSLFLQYLNVGSPGGSPEREQWGQSSGQPREGTMDSPAGSPEQAPTVKPKNFNTCGERSATYRTPVKTVSLLGSKVAMLRLLFRHTTAHHHPFSHCLCYGPEHTLLGCCNSSGLGRVCHPPPLLPARGVF